MGLAGQSISGSVYPNFPFDVITLRGGESVDFLQRISTNDFSDFKEGSIQKTLLISEKARVIDTVWVFHRGTHLELLCSKGNSKTVSDWLNKYVIMEDIEISTVRGKKIDLYFEHQSSFDYFGIPARIAFDSAVDPSYRILSNDAFEQFRIASGIPKAPNELTGEYNPLELNLWDFISFTKGCFIGQEVIARLDTYKKISKALCRFSVREPVTESAILIDGEGSSAGKVTSVIHNETFWGLAVLLRKQLQNQTEFRIKDSLSVITVDKIFSREEHGSN